MMGKRMLLLLPILLWMGFVFFMSAQPGDDSQETSLGVGRWIGSTFCSDWNELSINEQEAYAERIDHPVRKTAHAMEYTVMAVFAMIATMSCWEWKDKRRFVLAFLICVLYAVSDEWHQVFVPGRAGRITDVLIDTSGIIFGLVLTFVFHYIIRRKKHESMEL